jgi:hypothetical protein
MNTDFSGATASRTTSVVTGTFFITATVAAIAGLTLYDPLLNHTDYLTRGAQNSGRIVSGAVCELIAAASVAGTGIMLYPWLKIFDRRLALGYVCFRLLETVFILLGLVSVLALLTLSRTYMSVVSPDTAAFEAAGTALKAIHDWTFILGPNFMLGINTFLYSYVFSRSGLVPKKLSAFGITAALLVFLAALLELFGVIPQLSAAGVLLSFPIFIYELVLAVRLIRKGMNELPAKTRGNRIA